MGGANPNFLTAPRPAIPTTAGATNSAGKVLESNCIIRLDGPL